MTVLFCFFCKVTGVVGHRRLLAVPLLLKLDVAQLEHTGHHLQHACRQEKEEQEHMKIKLIQIKYMFLCSTYSMMSRVLL